MSERHFEGGFVATTASPRDISPHAYRPSWYPHPVGFVPDLEFVRKLYETLNSGQIPMSDFERALGRCNDVQMTKVYQIFDEHHTEFPPPVTEVAQAFHQICKEKTTENVGSF